MEGSLSAADIFARLPDAASAKAPEELDARITAAFAENAKSDDVQRVLADVEAAAKAAEAAAEHATERALDPLVDDVIVARGAMLDAAFKRDRLIEAAKRLGKRVDELKALEKTRAQRAEHERVSVERNRLADEMERMAGPIVQLAHLVRQIDLCDREVGRVNATSALALGYIQVIDPEAFAEYCGVEVESALAAHGLVEVAVAAHATGKANEQRTEVDRVAALHLAIAHCEAWQDEIQVRTATLLRELRAAAEALGTDPPIAVPQFAKGDVQHGLQVRKEERFSHAVA